MKLRVNDRVARAATVLLISTWALVAAAAQAADAMPGAPEGELITGSALKGGELIDDPAAFQGKATTSHGDSAALLQLDVPAQGDAFTVWAHHKGGPLQLKALKDGKQVEKDWKWVAPEGYAWTHMGRYTRADLGKGIIIIREKADKSKDVYIDAVVFSTDPKTHPPGVAADGTPTLPPDAPDPSLPPTAASVRIDWDKTVGQMRPAIWSINDEEVKSVAAASYPGVQAFLASLNPPIIRFLEGGRYKDWTDPKTHAWDAAKIKACYDACKTGYGNARYMYTIPGWPEWLPQKDRFLTPEGEDEFVKFIGQLVVVMRDKVGRKVTYWEVLNEHDERFATWGKLDQLHRLYNRLFAEIKKQDPTAKVGGPALTWANPVWLEPFLKHCAPNVDFVSWHSYASGNIYDSNPHVFARADAMASEARKAKEAVEKATAGRKVECFLDEYNVKWSWEPMERRHHNAVGAVFQACVLRRLGMVGLDGVMVWHSIGGAYGLAEPEPWNVGKPGKNPLKIGQTGRLYQIGSRCVHGSIVDAAVEGEKDIEVIAVTRADGVRSVLLINRACHTVVVSGADKLGVGKGKDNPTMMRIASDGLSSPQWKRELAGDAVRLPGYSVTLVTGDGSTAKLVQEPNRGG